MVAGLVCIAGWAAAGRPGPFVFLLYVALVTGSLWRTDLRERRLPNALVVPGYWFVIVGLVWEWARAGVSPLPALVAGVAYAGVLAAPALVGGVGMGDVKLGGMLGLALGSLGPIPALVGPVTAFVGGGVAALAALSVPGTRSTHELPFGPFMLGGFWLAVVTDAATLLTTPT